MNNEANAPATRTDNTRALNECHTIVKRAHAAHVRWHKHCTEVTNGTRTQDQLKGMPSKAAKYRMYDEARRLMNLAGITGERPHSLEEIGALLARIS